MPDRFIARVVAGAGLTAFAACTGPGLNAGEQGGVAFIVFTGMLVLTVLILYLVLGRSE